MTVGGFVFFLLTEEFGMSMGKDREDMLKTLHWIYVSNFRIYSSGREDQSLSLMPLFFCFDSVTSIVAVVKIQYAVSYGTLQMLVDNSYVDLIHFHVMFLCS